MTMPVLYSFRRCPYAIRARMALYQSGVSVELREVLLKDKPAAMLDISPKGTVPVLMLPDRVLDESIDIMRWSVSTTEGSLSWSVGELKHALIAQNDGDFKQCLDRYKYFDRHPEHSQKFYFNQALEYLQELESKLVSDTHGHVFLESSQASILDIAIFPFVRQFAFVDKALFDSQDLPKLLYWLNYWLDSPLFSAVMQKYPAWSPQQTEIVRFGDSMVEPLQ